MPGWRVGTHELRERGAQHLRGGRLQKVKKIPAQDAVHAARFVLEAMGQVLGKRRSAVARMAIEIGEQIFDENFAAQPFAEKGHVGPHDGSQIQQDGRLA